MSSTEAVQYRPSFIGVQSQKGRGQGGRHDSGQQPASSCLDSRDILEKVLEQPLHWYFLMSEWVWRCARRLERSAKARLQWGQEKGFSPKNRGHRHGGVNGQLRDRNAETRGAAMERGGALKITAALSFTKSSTAIKQKRE